MKVLIVVDDALVAQSLATILSAEQDVDVVGTGSSGPQAVARYRDLAPDVLLMDIRMPGGDGLSAAEEVLSEDPSTRIVFLTTFADDEYIAWALAMGARGYLIKQDIAQIAPALRGVMAGMSVLEGQVLARGVAARGGAGADPAAGGADPAAGGAGAEGAGSSRVVTSSREGSTVIAMRTVRPRFTDRAVVSLDCAVSSIHCLVKPLGTARRIVPSISPRGRAERSIDVATGPSSSVGTVSRAAAHARVREFDSTTTSGQKIR